MWQTTINTRLSLPPVARIHEVVIAFLRTSETGSWKSDDTERSDHFEMHFFRGNWGRNWLTGGRVPKLPFLHGDVTEADTIAMTLRITVRPSPRQLILTCRHTVFSPVPLSAECFWGPRVMMPAQDVIRQEVETLRGYLRECYDLAETPVIECVSD